MYSNNQQQIRANTDARVKIVLTLVFLLSLNSLPLQVWPIYILFLSLLYASSLFLGVKIGELLNRSLVALPFVISAFPLIFARDASTFMLFQGLGWSIPISLDGIQKFTSTFVKAWISVQAASLLMLSTAIPDLINGLHYLNVPQIFITIAMLMWRYLSVLVHEVNAMMTARSSRSGVALKNRRTGGTVFWRAKVTGGMAGSLFIRSMDRSERVYAAMQSRGYNGKLPAVFSKPVSRTSRLQIVAGGMLLIALWLFGMLIGG